MALTVALQVGGPSANGGGAVGASASGAPEIYVIGVTNAGAAAVALTSLQLAETTESDATVSQPVFQTPNVPYGTGFPVIAPGATSYFTAGVVFNNPYGPGPSPQAPGGAAPGNAAMNADANFTLTATAQSSDGSMSSGSLMVGVLSTIAPFPVAQGGATQFQQGFNLINGLVFGLV